MRKIFRCAIVQSIRTRTTSHDLDGRSKKPKQARAKSAKRSKKSNKSRKPKEKPCGPWPSLPSAVLVGRQHTAPTSTPGTRRTQSQRLLLQIGTFLTFYHGCKFTTIVVNLQPYGQMPESPTVATELPVQRALDPGGPGGGRQRRPDTPRRSPAAPRSH